jgi:hypothetical protein
MEEALERAASTKTAKSLLCAVANDFVFGEGQQGQGRHRTGAGGGDSVYLPLCAEVDRATGAHTNRSGKVRKVLQIDQSLERFIVAVRSDNGSCYFHWRRACGQAVQRQLLLGDAADGSAAGGDGGTGTGPRSLRLLLYQHSSSRGRPIDDR